MSCPSTYLQGKLSFSFSLKKKKLMFSSNTWLDSNSQKLDKYILFQQHLYCFSAVNEALYIHWYVHN